MTAPEDLPTLRWGVLGTGMVAGWFTADLLRSRLGSLSMVGSRSPARAEELASAYGARAAGSYDEVLGSADVDAVYIALPNNLHAEWAVKAVRAGKHVLVEKPLALTDAEAKLIFDAADAAGVVALEGLMYRLHPQMALVHRLVSEGHIGRVGVVETSFGGRIRKADNIRLRAEFGGGALLDRGSYGISLCRMIAGAAAGTTFAEPILVSGLGSVNAVDGVDEWSIVTMQFADGLITKSTVATQIPMPSAVSIWGTDGDIQLSNPWQAGFRDSVGEVRVTRGDQPPETIIVDSEPIYAVEADAFARAVRGELLPIPMADPADSLSNMRSLDRARSHIFAVPS